jgi:hypothetical protein
MIKGKTISTTVSKIGTRLQKFLGMGRKDVQETEVCQPFGIDGNAVKDMVAIYSPTLVKGETVVIGYINKNAIAEVGGLRLYSTNQQGSERAYVYLRANKDIELNGNGDSIVRYTPLNSGIQSEASLINQNLNLILANLTNLNSVVNGIIPGSVTAIYVPVPVTVDITQSKVNDVKTSA